MTVAELIEMLQKEPQDMKVYLRFYDSGCHHTVELREYRRESVADDLLWRPIEGIIFSEEDH